MSDGQWKDLSLSGLWLGLGLQLGALLGERDDGVLDGLALCDFLLEGDSEHTRVAALGYLVQCSVL